MNNFLLKFGLEIFDVEEINTHGGSIRFFIKKKINKKLKINSIVKNFLIKEKKLKINSQYPYRNFKRLIERRKNKIINLIKKLKKRNFSIVGYGAPAKASTIINFFKIDKQIDYMIDDNTLKNKKFIPDTKLQIFNKPKSKNIDYILVFAWNFFNEIKKKNKNLSNNFINVFNF